MQARLVNIVLKGGEREAVQAARLLSEIYGEAIEEKTQDEHIQSEASMVLERWRNRKNQALTAKRTTVVEEVTLGGEEPISARNDTVDAT